MQKKEEGGGESKKLAQDQQKTRTRPAKNSHKTHNDDVIFYC